MLRTIVALVGIALCSLAHAEGASPEEGANEAAFLARLEQIQVEIKNRLGVTLAHHEAGQPLPDWQELTTELEDLLQHLDYEILRSGVADRPLVRQALMDLRVWVDLLGRSQTLSTDQLWQLVAARGGAWSLPTLASAAAVHPDPPKVPSAGVQPPINDLCAAAIDVGADPLFGGTSGADTDGSAACSSVSSPDVWYRYLQPRSGRTFVHIASNFSSLVSVQAGCPADQPVEEFLCLFGAPDTPVVGGFWADAGEELRVRVAGAAANSSGEFEIRVGPGGVIEGRVVDAASGEALAGIDVRFSASSSFFSTTASTDDDGRYRGEDLEPGTYLVSADGGDEYLSEIFEEIPCDAPGCDVESAELIDLDIGSVRANVDFTLDLGGSISGRVSRVADDSPVEALAVELYDSLGNRRKTVLTDDGGNYHFGGLATGSYFLRTRGFRGERDEIWPDIPCFEECDVTRGVPVAVTQGSETGDIDFVLESLGLISGRVVDMDGQPLAGVVVTAYPTFTTSLFNSRSNRTDQDGRYSVNGLLSGTYTVLARDSFDDHEQQIYNGRPCPSPCDTSTGDRVLVEQGEETRGIDFELTSTGAISGTVVARQTGRNLNGCARVENEEGFARRIFYLDGVYRLGGLPAGQYQVVVEASDYLQQAWDGVLCPRGACEYGIGDTVEITRGQQVGGIDFQLDSGSRIRGRVTELTTDEPVESVIKIYDPRGVLRNVTSSADSAFPDGTWKSEVLPPGTYFAGAFSNAHQPEIYDGFPCPAEGCQPTLGTPIEVVAGEDTVGVDFAVRPLASISGWLQDLESSERKSERMELYNAAGELVDVVISDDETGEFTFVELFPGTYFLQIGGVDYLPFLFEDLPCPGGICNPLQGTPIEIEPGLAISDLVIMLDTELPLVTGRVSQGGVGVAARVAAYDSEGIAVEATASDSDGRYEIRLPSSGSYSLIATDRLGVVSRVFGGEACSPAECDPLTGTYLQVTVDEVVTGIDFDLPATSGFGGTVRDRVSGELIGRGRARLWRADGSLVERMDVLGNGRFFTEDPLLPGRYFLTLSLAPPYQDVLWQGLPCVGGQCDPTTGTPIDVTEGEPVDLNVLVSPATNDCGAEGGLCLDDSRFRVTAVWRRPDGSSGSGEAVLLSSDSGYLWFFDAANIELVVKVLDACAGRDRFWVFAAGLTNVEVDLTVTDTWTNTEKVYFNPLGRPFQPIQDTQAFSTCAAAPPRLFEASVAKSVSWSSPTIGLDEDLERRRQPELSLPTGQAKGLCVADATGLCLADGRFRVETFWARPNGESGFGQAVSLTGDTGYFWFFDSANIEAVVKVLDACAGRDRFWVFAAGLTNVEVVLRVTDTLTGEVKDYENPQGRAFQPVQDTQAFATCG